MARVALGLEYDGTGFAGWQFQTHARSVQGELQRALSIVADHPVEVTAAGRTDAGVHALRQVVHFDTQADRTERAWVLGANSASDTDVRVLWARPVAATFHARHAALSRTYRYRILNHPVRPALDRHRVSWSRRPLDAGLMQSAGRVLEGQHDFTTFRAAECQSRTSVRRLSRLTVERRGLVLDITVTANAFLHHMVRNIAGALMAVGRGDRPPGWIGDALAARDRRAGGVTAPPQGLYLIDVEYPPSLGLPRGGGTDPGAGCLVAASDL